MIKSTLLPNVQSYKVVDATRSLTIRVAPRHHKAALQCDGNKCVVAKAFDDSNVGEFYEGVEVGITVTKIKVPGKIIRYATPKELRSYIREFDLTGKWNLPKEVEFTFSPLTATARLGGRPNRWHRHRTNTDGSGRDVMKHRASPTRRISRA